MAKKRKNQDEAPTTKQVPEEEQELEQTSQKEINATLEMIIRTFDANAQNNDDGNGCSDDSDEVPEESPTAPAVPPCPAEKTVQPIIPSYFGSDNLFLTCVDIFVFEIDDDVLEKILFCAIFSMSFTAFLNHFKSAFIPSTLIKNQLEKQLDEQVANVYNQFILQIMNGIQTASNKRDYLKTFFQSHQIQPARGKNLLDLVVNNLQNFINATSQSALGVQNIHDELDHIIKNSVAAFLYQIFATRLAEFQNAVGIKIGCLQTDLTFLSSEILRLTSANAGIVQAANAVSTVIQTRFAEEDDFEEVFDAVEEIADVVEDLAEIYRDRLKVLRALLPFSLCPRPLVLPEKNDT